MSGPRKHFLELSDDELDELRCMVADCRQWHFIKNAEDPDLGYLYLEVIEDCNRVIDRLEELERGADG